MEQAREMGQELGVDTRQGSVYMDAATGHCIRAAKFYSDLSNAFDMLSIDTCIGDILDEKVKERGLERKEATCSYYNVIFDGVAAEDMVGYRFMVKESYFVLSAYDGEYYLKSEKTGTITNSLLPGQPVIPVRNTMNLKTATLGEIYIAGSNNETDDSLRKRFKAVIVESAENGNKQQYKTWCESFSGVGRAIIYPLAYGDNSVKAVIISSEGVAPTAALVEDIQEYIDPGHEGLGEGVAPIGCHFYAEAVIETDINFSFDAEIETSYAKETVIELATKKLVAYLKSIALNTSDSETMVIQYVKVVSILANVPGIKDFSNLQMNDATININIDEKNVAVLGEVTMNVSV